MKSYSDTNIRLVSIIGIIWWFSLFLIAGIAPFIIPFKNSFANYSIQEVTNLPVWIERWTNFDGGAYIIIAESGYREMGLLQAYFPGYPVLIQSLFKLSWPIFKISGISDPAFRMIVASVINLVCTGLLLYILDLYLAKRFDKKIRVSIIIAFIIFPFSFFLHAIYTEAVFLLLLTLCFYSYQRGWWIRLSFFIFALTFTRIVGIFIVPALLVDLFLSKIEPREITLSKVLGILKNEAYAIISILTGSIGLLSYMVYLHKNFGDALLFFHVQSSFGAGRQQTIVIFPQVVWRYLKIIWTTRPFDLKYFAYFQEFCVTLIVLCLLIAACYWRKKYKLTIAELLFSFGAFFLPPLTGNFSSMPRYVLVCLPIFILMGQYIFTHKIAKILYITFCLIWSFLNIILFIQGHWVA